MSLLSWENSTMERLEPQTAQFVLRDVNPFFRPLPMKIENTVARFRPLSFYAGYMLYACTDYSMVPALTRFALRRPGSVHVIDWTSGPIYAVNKQAPLDLSYATVGDYLRFFFAFVDDFSRPRRLVERITDIPFIADPSAEQRHEIERLVRPMRMVYDADDTGVSARGGFIIEACFVVASDLIQQRVAVTSDGRVSVASETLLAENIPARATIGPR